MTNETPNPTAVDYVNRGLRLRQVLARVSLSVREQLFQLFIDNCAPGPSSRVLDIGVTPANDLPESNYFEKLYPYRDNITATSIEDAARLEEDFPGLTFVRTKGVALPFSDGEFDIAFSSAVLEHVGDRARQRAFLAEMVRVSRCVFLTTPNRWFPIELHTALPLLHWLPQRLHQAVLLHLGHGQWASTDNLNLLSAHELAELLPAEQRFAIHRHRVAGLCSNLVVWSVPDR